MIRIAIAVIAATGLSACGGTRFASQNARIAPPPPPPVVQTPVIQTFDGITGEISTIAAPTVPGSVTAPAPVTSLAPSSSPVPSATPVAATASVPAPGSVTAPAPVPVAAPAPLPFATGPIFRACQADNRKAASRARCGCVQAVAERSLSNADQKRGAKFFKDPGALQEVRQSDNPRNERFWLAWKAFGQDATAQCRNS